MRNMVVGLIGLRKWRAAWHKIRQRPSNVTIRVFLKELNINLHSDFDDRKSKGNEGQDVSQNKAIGPIGIGTMPSEIHEGICINKCIPKFYSSMSLSQMLRPGIGIFTL